MLSDYSRSYCLKLKCRPEWGRCGKVFWGCASRSMKKALYWIAKTLPWPVHAGDSPPKMYHPSRSANLSSVAQTDEALLLWGINLFQTFYKRPGSWWLWVENLLHIYDIIAPRYCQSGKDFLFWSSVSWFLGRITDSTSAVVPISPRKRTESPCLMLHFISI